MQNYQSFLQHILDNGTEKSDRTGTGTKSVFGYQMRYDLSKVFPLVTTKKVHLKSIIYELLWFLKGDTNAKYLQEKGPQSLFEITVKRIKDPFFEIELFSGKSLVYSKGYLMC